LQAEGTFLAAPSSSNQCKQWTLDHEYKNNIQTVIVLLPQKWIMGNKTLYLFV
jgi:hypothetical protein